MFRMYWGNAGYGERMADLESKVLVRCKIGL
jgi:hypothetical protein